ncbi:MAG TPA: hypothetical protein VGH84_05665 [Steroidobacteraceae bacterium]
MSDRIEPNAALSVTLPARQWNSVLAMMGEGLTAVSGILADIQRQCMTQSQQTAPAPTPMRMARPNGEAVADG